MTVKTCTAAHAAAAGPKRGTYAVSTGCMGPGKLILKEGAWWYARCKTYTSGNNTDYSYTEFEEPIAIALAPLNACCGLEQTQLVFASANSQDDYKRHTSVFY